MEKQLSDTMVNGETKSITSADGETKPGAMDTDKVKAQLMEPPTTAQRGAARAKVTKALVLLGAASAERNPDTVKKILPLCKDALDECLRQSIPYSGSRPLSIRIPGFPLAN